MRWFFIQRRPRRKRKIHKVRRQEYLKEKEKARSIILPRLLYWSETLQIPIRRVAIRDQSTRWGSCSKKGNLNFNYRIAFLPVELLDYVLVHELCHLREFNHSPSFWSHVEASLPDYRLRMKALRLMPIGEVSVTPVH